MIPQFPLPGGSEFTSQPIYVWCTANHHRSCGSDSNKTEYPAQLQPADVRIRCGTCKFETIELSVRSLSWAQICDTSSRQRGHCYGCGSQSPVEFFYRCQGMLMAPTEGRTVCKAVSYTGYVSPLPGVLNNEARIPSVDTLSADSIQIVFHPCGHRMSATGLPNYLKASNCRQALVRNSASPEQLGYFVLKCCDRQCRTGMIPRPTVRIAGREWYLKVAQWATQEHVLAAGGVLCPSCHIAFDAPRSQWFHTCPACHVVFCEIHRRPLAECSHSMDLRQRIVDAFKQGATQGCPSGCFADIGPQKDGNCTHMECSKCQVRWCYFCGKPKPEYFCRNGCPWYMNRYHLTKSDNDTVALCKFHRLKTLRLLRNLRATVDLAEFDRVFSELEPAERTITIHLSPDTDSASTTISIEQIREPPPQGQIMSDNRDQTICGTRPLIDFP